MTELNEKLAEVCGLTIYDDPEHGTQYLNANGKIVCSVEAWNPTSDLNQLWECYLALSEEQQCQFEEIAPQFFVAVFTAPELVAQAILKAKGVEV